MVFPLVKSPLGGVLGATTASFFRLDPTGTVALEPLLDLIPGYSPLRVTFDMVDGWSFTADYTITEHPIQGFLDVASHINAKPKGMTIQGFLSALPPFLSGANLPMGTALPPGPSVVPAVPGSFSRLDLMRLLNLVESIADRREPIMVVTPWWGFARAGITAIGGDWTPADGESCKVVVAVKEVRIVSPLTGDMVPDYPAQPPANSSVTEGGVGNATEATSSATSSSTPGGAPTVGAAA